MWTWIIGGLVVWALAALVVGVVLGRALRLADQSAHGTAVARTGTAPVARARRRKVPLPPVGIGLAIAALGLESIGYVLRLSGATGGTARLFDMDAPYSLPRMYVAALFAAAAVAAVAGAARNPGRRTWWLAVGAVAAVIAAVKAGSTVHSDAVDAFAGVFGTAGAVAVSAVAALTVLAVLTFLSRAERRDRRRVLLSLALYAATSVGLAGVSAVLEGGYGRASTWAVAATFVEESGEALAGVAVLVAVLIGVAPRLVLPPDWALRRRADAQTLDVPAPAPRRAVGGGPLS